jgi:hypothetical protein
MLIPSILWNLDHSQLQTKIIEKAESGFQAALTAAGKQLSGLEKAEAEIETALERVKAFDSETPHSEKPFIGSGMAELLRAITKFEKSNQSRVVDFFE